MHRIIFFSEGLSLAEIFNSLSTVSPGGNCCGLSEADTENVSGGGVGR